MGGPEYLAYVRYVVEQTFGTENVKDVDVNAVYDGHGCTIDAYMMDGRWYLIPVLLMTATAGLFKCSLT